jgi:penicillin-binding protein 1A
VTGAIVVAEDSDFYQHPGIDLLGIARAMWVNLRAGRVRQGGSTITQQVAKTFFLTPERTLGRKLEELVLARRLERELTKDEILGLYVNQIYFGHGRYGIEEAAQFFFARSARELSAEQAATLAAVIPAPVALSPLRRPDRARRRRDAILHRMEREGVLASGEAARFAALPLAVAGQAELPVGLGGYYVAAVARQIARELGHARLVTGGLRISTALHLPMQLEAERAVREGLVQVDRRFGYARPLEVIARHELPARRQALLREQGRALATAGQVLTGIVVRAPARDGAQPDGRRHYEVDIGGRIACMSLAEEERYRDPGTEPGTLYEEGALLRVALRLRLADVPEGECPPLNLEQGPQAALVVLETESRRVLAQVGGSDALTRPFDRSVQARRQMGSTFKPIVFAAALASGKVAPSAQFENRRRSYRGAGGRSWRPSNYGGHHDGRLVGLTEALARSLNVVAVEVLRTVGVKAAVDLAHGLGIQGPLPRDLSLALGSGEANLMELTNAYATFAAGGGHRLPVGITRVFDAQGNELFRGGTGPPRQVVPADVASQVQRMLVAAVEEGTGEAARQPGARVWGKTGTTDKAVDTWFVGGLGGLTIGLWVGFDDRRPLEGTAGTVAVPIWADFAASTSSTLGAQQGR